MEIKFKKVHTAKDLTISGLVFLAGIGLYFVKPELGIVIAVCGALLFLFYKAGYKCEGHDTLLSKKGFDIAYSCKQSIVDYLAGKDVEPKFDQLGNDGEIRLETFFNKKAGIVYAQLFVFSNYMYEKATETVELHHPEADKILKHL